ncbi:pyridoxamine 5'-phosphate oxidase family protein [Schinkia sp. CFF1]
MVIPEKFLEVLQHEGVATIGTFADGKIHLSNTWNSYMQISDGKLLYPAGGMNTTEANVEKNNQVMVTIGSREVEGFHGPGTGFRIVGTATFLKSGAEFEEFKQSFPWARAVVEITIESITQTL